MPPGGDPAFLIFWFFFIKKKEHETKGEVPQQNNIETHP